MIILIGGQKGGPGKSTLVQNLGAYFVMKQGHDVMLVDADEQATTADWTDERAANLALSTIHCIQKSGRLESTLRDLDRRYDIILIDVGGQDNIALRSAMTVAHLMVVPLRPKRRDLKTLPHVAEVVALGQALNPQLTVRSIIMQAPTLPSQVTRILNAKEVCANFGIEPLQNMTFNRNVYDDIDEGGLSVFEAGDKKAITELTAIGDEIMILMRE